MHTSVSSLTAVIDSSIAVTKTSSDDGPRRDCVVQTLAIRPVVVQGRA